MQYLTSESVLIVSGRTWYQDVSVGLYRLGRLASIDTAALVVALGHFVDEIPAGDGRQGARKLTPPVLLLPAGALTRTVLSYVYHALASADLHRLRRTVAMQNDLLDLLIAEAGVDELLAKVSLLIGMPMLLLDGAGALVTSMGEVDPHRRAREVWEHWGELTDASAWGSSRWARSGSSAATSCSTASWSGSWWRRRHRAPAPSSWTWRSPSCSASSRWSCSSAATRSSPRGASAAACCATSSPAPAPRRS